LTAGHASAQLCTHENGRRISSLFAIIGLLWIPLAAASLDAAEAAPSLEQRVALLEKAAAPPAINAGDNAWLLVSSALVLMMTAPGLILFYGGWSAARTSLPQ